MKKKLQTLIAVALLAAPTHAQVVLNIDATRQGAPVSPMLYGIFFEDINHAADGGLYAELISNRSFEDDTDQPANWHATGGASMQLTKKNLLNAVQHQALTIQFAGQKDKPSGVANDGFWGIHAVQGRTYQLSFWAKGKLGGILRAQLTSADGQQIYASADIDTKLTNKWTRLTATLTTKANDPKAQFRLVCEAKGWATIDVVSLFPPTFKNRPNGCRPDLAQMLQNLRPKFMRFPGGCFVEGQESPDNAFHWEKTIGPIEEREGHLNRNWSYRTSDGLGFHEYLQLSEDLGAKPLYVVNIGLWHGGLTPVEELQPWIDECLNALEYANGPVTSKYGAMRAKNGHPEPFNIEYLEIGNENNQRIAEQQSDRYYERFKKFKDAVLARYPNMHLIGNVVAWGDDNPTWDSSEPVELLDEHYYRNPAWFTDNFTKYDSYARGGAKVYCGEYAVTQGFGRVGSLNAALGEAVFMMGMEYNGDVVEMASYAPIFVNENNVAWQPDMIRFNSSRAMGTPSYYVQKLMAENVGTRNIALQQHNPYRYEQKAAKTKANSHFGYATWGTQATYQLVSLTDLNNPADVFTTDSPEDGWMPRGDWQVGTDATLSQRSSDESCIYASAHRTGTDNYDLKVRARKDGGNEGFMVVFNYEDADNYCWANFGGWGNTQHGIEQVVGGAKMQTATRPGTVETGRWYDVTIRVEGDSITCWLDNDQVFATRLMKNTTPGIFSVAQIDEQTGELIVKVVNTSDEATTAQLCMDGFKAREARLTRLTSKSGDDENTLDAPTMVFPTEEAITTSPDELQLDVPAYSLNIVRIKQ